MPARTLPPVEFGAWTPIGAVQTATGYDVAWEIPGANEYTIWSTDSNGNYIATSSALVSGNRLRLESIETTFNQDLNGDGTIGLTTDGDPDRPLVWIDQPDRRLRTNIFLYNGSWIWSGAEI